MRTTIRLPIFKKPEVAVLLRCSDLTISNREKRGVYPLASRNHANHRIYLLSDIFELMYITEGHIYLEPIVSMLFEKGYNEKDDVQQYLNAELQKYQHKTAVTKEKSILHE